MNVLGAAVAVLLGVAVVCDASFLQSLWTNCFGEKMKGEQIDAIRKCLVKPIQDMFTKNQSTKAPTRFGLVQADPKMTNWMDESWRMSVTAGEIVGLPEVQLGQLRCSFFNKNWLDDQCTLGISFATLTFAFYDMRHRVDAGDKTLPGRSNVTYEGVHFHIVLTRGQSNQTLRFKGLDYRFMYVQHMLALETTERVSLTELELYCLLEFLMSNVKYTVEQDKYDLMETVNTHLLNSNVKTDCIEAYDQINKTFLEESGDFETILIKPLADLFLKASTQFQLNTFNQNLMNWQTEAWFMSVDSGNISGLSSALFDSLLCGLSEHNETEWTVDMHFTQLTFQFFNLTYRVASNYSKTIPGSTMVNYKDVRFNIVVREKEEKGNEVAFSDMHCHYNNRASGSIETETELSNTLVRLYLEKFLMANIEHYIQKHENKHRYLKAANDIALETITKPDKCNVSEPYRTQVADLEPQQLLWILHKPLVELISKDARPLPLALKALNTKLTNWPDEAWKMKVSLGQIRNLTSVKSDTVRCSYSRRRDEHVCTYAIHFEQLAFDFYHLELIIDDEGYDYDDYFDYYDLFSGWHNITYEDVHFDIVVTAGRRNKFVGFAFNDMYARYSHTVRLVACSPDLTALTESEHFCLLEFLMTNVRHFIEKKENKNSFLNILNKLL